MKNFYLGLCFLAIIIVGCGSTQNSTSTQTFGGKMINSFEKTFSNAQFDSICKADAISNNLSKNWKCSSCIDGETNEVFNEYLFIKNTTVYRAIKVGNDSIKITKRIIK